MIKNIIAILLYLFSVNYIFSDASIKLGCSTSLTGSNREYGEELIKGTKLYIEHINKYGGIHGKYVRFIYYDDVYNPEIAIENTIKLINDNKVDILFNYSGTPTITAILPYLKIKEQSNILLFAPITGSSAVRTPPYNQYIYTIRPSYMDEAQNIVKYLSSQGLLKIGIFYQMDAFGRSGFSGINASLKNLNKFIITETTYKRGINYFTDMQIQVKKLLSTDINAIVTVGNYEAVAAFIRDIRKQNISIPIINFSYSAIDSVVEILLREKTLLNNLYFSQVLPHYSETEYNIINEYKDLIAIKELKPSMISLEAYINTAILTEKLRNSKQKISNTTIKEIIFSKNIQNKNLLTILNKVYLYTINESFTLKEVSVN